MQFVIEINGNFQKVCLVMKTQIMAINCIIINPLQEICMEKAIKLCEKMQNVQSNWVHGGNQYDKTKTYCNWLKLLQPAQQYNQRKGRIQGGAVRGAPPPLDFHNLKRKSTVAHHSNRKRGRRLGKKKKYISFPEL